MIKLWNVKSIKEAIKDKKSKKKGFVLIELIIAAALIGIVTSTQVIVISKYMKIHREEIKESRENFYVNEAFMIIESEISSSKYAYAKDNKISLKRYEDNGENYIRMDKDSDIIISYGAVYSATSNNIMRKVKDFKVEENGNLLYITIETMGGKIYKRCLALERGKAKKDLY